MTTTWPIAAPPRNQEPNPVAIGASPTLGPGNPRLAERPGRAHTQLSHSYPEVVMPATSPPMGSDLPPTPGAPLSDPRSLEQYFRSHFTELATEAKSQLDDAGSAAPRVVEGAFRHAWEERERILTPQDLDAFLHDEVRHGVAREKSRRASLHRHDPPGAAKAAPHATTTVDVDQSWAHLSRALHLGADDTSI